MPIPGAGLGLALDRVGIVAGDPASCGALLHDAFGAVPCEDTPGDLLVGDARLRLERADATLPSPPRALSYLGLRTYTLGPLRDRLEAAGMGWTEVPADSGGVALRLESADWCGIAVTIVESAPRPVPVAVDGNVVGIDHIGVASTDNARAEERFRDVLGMAVESRQTDTETLLRVEQFTSDRYGLSVATSRVAHSGLRASFLSLANVDLELLADLAATGPSDAAPSSSTAGDRTAIARYVERSGPGLHHLALRVRDIDAALARAESAGVRLLDREGRPGSRRARIGVLDPHSTARILFHFVERE